MDAIPFHCNGWHFKRRNSLELELLLLNNERGLASKRCCHIIHWIISNLSFSSTKPRCDPEPLFDDYSPMSTRWSAVRKRQFWIDKEVTSDCAQILDLSTPLCSSPCWSKIWIFGFGFLDFVFWIWNLDFGFGFRIWIDKEVTVHRS